LWTVGYSEVGRFTTRRMSWQNSVVLFANYFRMGLRSFSRLLPPQRG
jgi:hypothetical protein